MNGTSRHNGRPANTRHGNGAVSHRYDGNGGETTWLLDAVVTFILRYLVMTEVQACAIALWVLHTYALEAAEVTPYLSITSAEKESGKTRLLEVLELLVSKPWLTGRISAAALVRKVHRDCPTLLLDESDAAFRGEREYAEALRGLLNTGHRRNGRSTVCVGQGAKYEVVDMTTFCPKAVAGIGRLPDTVESRAISIRLKKRAPDEPVERFRQRQAEQASRPIREQAERWVVETIESLRHLEPSLPNELGDRAQDSWEPLLAIADLAGRRWTEAAKRAAVELSGRTSTDNDSRGVRLLGDIRKAFGGSTAMATATLAERLNTLEESEWGAWNGGAGIKPRNITKTLREFGLKTRTVRERNRTLSGYHRDQLEDPWKRYLLSDSPPSQHPPHRSAHGDRDVADVANFLGWGSRAEEPLALNPDIEWERVRQKFPDMFEEVQ